MHIAPTHIEKALLPTGVLLVAGGTAPGERPTSRSCLIDFRSGSAMASETGRLHFARLQNTVTLLQDGRVLVVGGYGEARVEEDGVVRHSALKTVEVYDGKKGTWLLLPPLAEPRVGHAIACLPDGRVMVIGGVDQRTENGLRYDGMQYHRPLASVEIIDVLHSRVVPGPSLPEPRLNHVAVTTQDGTIVVCGGSRGLAVPGRIENPGGLLDALCLRPTESDWSAVKGQAVSRISGHSITPIDGNRIVVIGGTTEKAPDYPPVATGCVEWLDVAAGRWHIGRDCPSARSGHSATLLSDGRILVIGGQTNRIGKSIPGGQVVSTLPNSYLRHLHAYDVARDRWDALGELRWGRWLHMAIRFEDSRIVVFDGESAGHWYESIDLREE